ncbi:universal stress protein [Thermodesulfobacteriota bacterium]
MYKTILIPLDGSKRAERILKHAENLAQRFQSKLILIQVVRPPEITSADPSGMVLYYKEANQCIEQADQCIKQAESYLAALKGEFREKGIETRTHVLIGPVVKTIIDLAEREAVDLIAMTSHGRSGLARVFYGSVAAGILQAANRPLFLIRSRNE